MVYDRRRLLRACAGVGSLALAGCTEAALPGSTGSEDEKIDDWQYDPADAGNGSANRFGGTDGEAVEADADDSIGLAAGGAADVSTFRQNVREGYLPTPASIAYEGLFHEYYFDTGGDGSCTSLFCPTYTPAVSPDPFSDEREQFLSVGLDSGLSQTDFERPALNLVIVLDISGSMRASFTDYYYDQYGGAYYYDEHGNKREIDEDDTRPKMDVAKDALVSLTRHLRPDNRFGVVLFNSDAAVAKPLRKVGKTDMDAIRGHIQADIRAGGGTNISAAMDAAEELMADYEGADHERRENRSIVITDAQINWGETNADELRSSLEANAEANHHTTVVGVGVDFNADLIDQITSVRGANYYSVYTESAFERRLDEEFEYMVTPLVYDLSLELEAEHATIVRVYGSTAADEATGELMHVNTLFPSPRTDGEARGGVVLVQVDVDHAGEEELELTASWETRDGEVHETTEHITFPTAEETYESDAIRKSILLSRYASLLREWTVYERKVAAGETEPDDTADADAEGIDPPASHRLGEWEQQSVPLSVSDRYDTRLRTFADHLESEMAAVGDDDLEQELTMLETILETG
ncbi:vWA domain-containing protein [Natronosalvus vescus]|uniref:vWA domain-containing protein n=1 Tax=Natronosalvus vescus TaxID=2953881 RepID=UPI002091790A|nr:VWA domain-containing protein [Natronosalvus vescus]